MRQAAYLDYNATVPLRPQARAALVAALDSVGNASSIHRFGRLARRTIEDAREQLAAFLNVLPRQIVFTAGATEANSGALRATCIPFVRLLPRPGRNGCVHALC